MDGLDWLHDIQRGNFTALPQPLTWADSLHFAHLVHGYRVSLAMGWGELRDWANVRICDARRMSQWHGSALELWCCLFYEHRRYRHAGEGEPEGEELALVEQLCGTLRQRLQKLKPVEHVQLMAFITR